MSHWDNELFSSIVGSLSMLVPGLVFVVRPDIMAKWVKTAHPQLDEKSPSTKITIRLIAAGFIFIGLLIAAGIADKALR